MAPWRSSRQPATLHEKLSLCNTDWERDQEIRWVCRIGKCSKIFSRKGLLVWHRGQSHGLAKFERNIPDQRSRRKKDKGEGNLRAAEQLRHPGAGERSCLIPEDDLIKRLLKLDAARRNSDFEMLNFDELQSMCSRVIESIPDPFLSTCIQILFHMIKRIGDETESPSQASPGVASGIEVTVTPEYSELLLPGPTDLRIPETPLTRLQENIGSSLMKATSILEKLTASKADAEKKMREGFWEPKLSSIVENSRAGITHQSSGL
ncbi:hypothetical protein M758_12G027200 [Ceratodon purpureus]|nr:hypothetical protein M758_12G027200 [Ceratodon purpureus]